MADLSKYWRGVVGAWSPHGRKGADSLRDWSGFGNEGALTGLTTADLVTSRFKHYSVQSLDFQSGEYATITADNTVLDLDSASQLSLVAWIYIRSYQASSPNIRAIAGRNPGGGGSQYFLRLGDSGSQDIIQWVLRVSGVGEVKLNSGVVSLSEWHQVIGTWDGVTMRLFVDFAETNVGRTGALLGSSVDFYIGRSTTGRTFDGMIDDVRVYNRCLAPREVHEMYALGPQGLYRSQRKTRLIVPTGGTTHQGEAALTGSAALTADGDVTFAGAAALSASATVSADADVTLAGAAALAGSAALTADGDVTLAGSAALSGTASLTADGDVTLAGAIALAGSATLTADGSLVTGLQQGEAALTGSATVTSDGDVTLAGAIALAGSATLSADADVTLAGAAALSGSLSLTAAGSLVGVAPTVPGLEYKWSGERMHYAHSGERMHYKAEEP